MEDDDPFSFFEELLEIEEGTEHFVDELRTNTGAFVEEALVEKLLENLDFDDEDEHDAPDVVSFFDSFHFSSMSVLQFNKKWEYKLC